MICPACDHDNIPGADLCVNCQLDLAGLDVEAWGVDPDDPILTTKIERLPLKQALTLAPDATVADAIDAMRREHVGCVLVCEGRRVVGILTEHDVAARVAARGRDPGRLRADEVMTPNPVVLQIGDPLAWALHRMGVDGQRHVPVLRDGALEGVLSSRTVLEVLLRD